MLKCKHLRLLEKQASGRQLYECEIEKIRLGSASAGLCLECENYEPDIESQAEKFIYLDWHSVAKGDVFHCRWKIFASDDVLKRDDIETIKHWTDEKVKTSGEINFNKAGNRYYELKISGRGHDNRCTWCESFRTALNTRTDNLVEQRGSCKFEKHRVK